MREMVQETRLHPSDLIYPLFLHEGVNNEQPISSLPGVSRLSPDLALEKAKEARDLGIPALLLFGIVPDEIKDGEGSIAFDPNNIVCEGIRQIKQACPEIGLIADLCFCEYTDHGHCGPLTSCGNGAGLNVDNEQTCDALGRQAVVLAEAGADVIAPSGMMDGMVTAIRDALDEAGFNHTPVMSYAAKFASSFYGPFREAAGCALGAYADAPKDRKGYQMNSANAKEALREVEADIAQGADMLIVKPSMPYLDILRQTVDLSDMPVFSYHVSGEYAMLKAAAAKGWLDYQECLLESLLAFKRAGASGIITYGALDAASAL